MTSAPMNPRRTQLTLFAEDFPVKTSAAPASGPESKKEQGQDCSLSSCASFAWFSPDTSSWKTFQRSLLTDWEPFLGSWPKQGLMLNGRAYRHPIWEPATAEIGGGASLATPRAVLAKNNRIDTPCNLRRAKERKYLNLEEQMVSELPTPQRHDVTHNHMHGAVLRHRDLAGTLSRQDSIPTGKGMYLNPCFVEEMMGYPIGHSDCKH